MAALSAEQIAAYAYQAGFRGESIATITAIALAESGGNPRAHNPRPPDDSYGLTQVNMLGGLGPARRASLGLARNEDLYDPLTNLRAAFSISSQGTNFGPWSTFKNGAYRSYLPAVRSGISIDPPGDWTDPGGGPGGWIPTPGDLPSPSDVVGAVAGAFGAAVEPFVNGLRRLTIIGIAVLGGVALVVAGTWRGVKVDG